jgi:hypothetical protein
MEMEMIDCIKGWPMKTKSEEYNGETIQGKDAEITGTWQFFVKFHRCQSWGGRADVWKIGAMLLISMEFLHFDVYLAFLHQTQHLDSAKAGKMCNRPFSWRAGQGRKSYRKSERSPNVHLLATCYFESQ